MNVILKHIFWSISYGPYGTIESRKEYEGWIGGILSINHGRAIIVNHKDNVLFSGSIGLLDKLMDMEYIKEDI